MPLDRRHFLSLTAGHMLASGLAPAALAQSATRSRFKAIAFDAFPVFDPRPIGALTESLIPGKGAELWSLWRTKLFEYQWLRALSGQYADFMHAVEDSLQFASTRLGLSLSSDDRRKLIAAWTNLQVWPDAVDAITTLHDAGVRLCFLSNMTFSMLNDGIGKAGLRDKFDEILSTDPLRTYKPDPRAFQLALDKLRLKREEILFVAFAGWDVAGAKWFGYPTFWVNRLNSPMEELGVAADGSGPDLKSLVQFVRENNTAG